MNKSLLNKVVATNKGWFNVHPHVLYAILLSGNNNEDDL